MRSHSHYLKGYVNLTISDYNSSGHQVRTSAWESYKDLNGFKEYCDESALIYYRHYIKNDLYTTAVSDTRFTLTVDQGTIAALT
jgi:hypothetical protein